MRDQEDQEDQPSQMPSRPPVGTWKRPLMAAAIATRDFTRVYRLLNKTGITQRELAALAGQSQPEVSAVIQGRKVMAYDVMLRIIDGFGIPRSLAGLCRYDCCDRGRVVATPPSTEPQMTTPEPTGESEAP